MKIKTKILLTLILFVLPFTLRANTNVSGTIYGDVVWSVDGNPYVVSGDVFITSTSTLTIDPGVVVKFSTDNSGLVFEGTLRVLGEEANRVVFTSIKDDSAFGDTNGDLFLSTPTSGDWRSILFLNGSVGEINFADIRYGGKGLFPAVKPALIENKGGQVTINDSKLSNGNYGVFQGLGSLNINNSEIADSSEGIYTEGNGVREINIESTIFKDNSNHGVLAFWCSCNPEDTLTVSINNSTFDGNKYPAFLEAPTNFLHSNNTAVNNLRNAFYINGATIGEQTFQADSVPYLTDFLSVAVGSTLTVEPGVIMKLEDNGQIFVEGNLISEGFPENNIYITSVKNDSVVGDTNNDGSLSTPASGDWKVIQLNSGSSASIKNTKISYGGRAIFSAVDGSFIRNEGGSLVVADTEFLNSFSHAVYQRSGSFDITSSVFLNSPIGILSEGGTGTVSQSDFSGVSDSGVNNYSLNSTDARNNWWGDATGPIHDSLNPGGLGVRFFGDVLFDPWLKKSSEQQPIIPVLIIPGIAGTELYDEEELIWPNLSEMLLDNNDNFLTESLLMDTQGKPIKNTIKTGEIIERIPQLPILDTNIFSKLFKKLEMNNYAKNIEYFTIPYDWRLNINDLANNIDFKIKGIVLSTNSDKVNIIAHSMGGLLIKRYIDKFGSDNINKIIFIGTPHIGTPKSAKILIEGDRYGIPWLEEDRIKEIAINSPSVYQLLPNTTYFSNNSGYIKPYSLLTSKTLNYTQTKDFLINKKNLNKNILDAAEEFFNLQLENKDYKGTDVYNFSGCSIPTHISYNISAFGSIGIIKYGTGDGTVPLVSSDYINVPNNNKFYIRNGKHSELPSLEQVSNAIINILKDEKVVLSDNLGTDQLFCNIKGKIQVWRSPVDVHIYDSEGRHAGPLENNSIESSIPGVQYEIMGGEKFIFLPTGDGQEYRTVGYATDNGHFDLVISENDSGEIISTTVFNDVPINNKTVIKFNVNQISDDKKIIIENNGKVETQEADFLGGNEINEDLISPNTKIKIYGKKYNTGRYKKKIIIKLNSSDEGVGVFKTYYSLNGSKFIEYNKGIYLNQKGQFELNYYSVDFAGNNEDIKKVIIDIGKSKFNKKYE